MYVVCTCKMARLVLRYSDDAGAIIENVYKFCTEEKKSEMKLSLNRVWYRTAALTGVSRLIAQKIVKEKKKVQDEQQQPKQPPPSTSKVSLDDFDQGVVRRTIASIYSLKKVLLTLDNIRTELKQNISLWGESKSADGETRCSPQQGQIPSHGQGVEVGYTVIYTDETYVQTSHAVPKDSTTGLKIPFSKE